MARRVEKIIEDAVFGNEEEFLKEAIREMVRKYEIQELDKRMDTFAREMAIKHPKSISEAVLAVRLEEDENI